MNCAAKAAKIKPKSRLMTLVPASPRKCRMRAAYYPDTQVNPNTINNTTKVPA